MYMCLCYCLSYCSLHATSIDTPYGGDVSRNVKIHVDQGRYIENTPRPIYRENTPGSIYQENTPGPIYQENTPGPTREDNKTTRTTGFAAYLCVCICPDILRDAMAFFPEHACARHSNCKEPGDDSWGGDFRPLRSVHRVVGGGNKATRSGRRNATFLETRGESESCVLERRLQFFVHA